MRSPLGKPLRPCFGDAGNAALPADVGVRPLVEAAAPPAADQRYIAFADLGPLRLFSCFKVGWGDLVARHAGADPECGGYVEKDTAPHHRCDRVHAVLEIAATDTCLNGVGTTMQTTLVGDVGKRIDVRADVRSGDDHVVGGG